MVDISNRERHKLRPSGWLPFLCAATLAALAAAPARSQIVPVPPSAVPAVVPQVHLINQNTPIIAQVPSPGVLPTDATKGNLLQNQATAYPGFRLRVGQRLPANMWLQVSTEANQRLDTNVFLTYKQPQPDYVFRINPNVTVGYNLFGSNFSVYGQYFVIKDCYTVHHRPLTQPTTQSVAGGVRYQFNPWFGNRVSTYVDCQVRELFQSKRLRQADINPSINISYFRTPRLTFFASALLQMRGGYPFVGATREIDPFYTLNMYYRRNKWVLSITDTFITNYREPHFAYSIPRHGNVNMITDIEVDRQIGRWQGVQLFVRGEPVFNWRSANAIGLSGFTFRLYSGMRVSFYKPSYGSTMKAIKKQLQQQDQDPNVLKAKKGKGKGKGKGKSKGKDDDQKNPDGTPTTPGTSDPTKNNSPKAPGDAAFEPDSSVKEAVGRAFGSIIAPAAGAIVSPAHSAIFAPTIGITAPSATSKDAPPMAQDAATTADTPGKEVSLNSQKTPAGPQA